jgi:hypothetical protein
MHYGEKVQKKATRNLGEFIATVAQNSGARVETDLVDPSKQTVQKGMIAMAVLSGAMAGAGASAASSGDFASAAQLQNSAVMLQTMATTMVMKQDHAQMQQDSWARQLARRGFDFAREIELEEVEELLGVA